MQLKLHFSSPLALKVSIRLKKTLKNNTKMFDFVFIIFKVSQKTEAELKYSLAEK